MRRVSEHRCILGEITYSNDQARARAVVIKMGVISVLRTLKFDIQCLLESHLSMSAGIHKSRMHTHNTY